MWVCNNTNFKSILVLLSFFGRRSLPEGKPSLRWTILCPDWVLKHLKQDIVYVVLQAWFLVRTALGILGRCPSLRISGNMHLSYRSWQSSHALRLPLRRTQIVNWGVNAFLTWSRRYFQFAIRRAPLEQVSVCWLFRGWKQRWLPFISSYF